MTYLTEIVCELARLIQGKQPEEIERFDIVLKDGTRIEVKPNGGTTNGQRE